MHILAAWSCITKLVRNGCNDSHVLLASFTSVRCLFLFCRSLPLGKVSIAHVRCFYYSSSEKGCYLQCMCLLQKGTYWRRTLIKPLTYILRGMSMMCILNQDLWIFTKWYFEVQFVGCLCFPIACWFVAYICAYLYFEHLSDFNVTGQKLTPSWFVWLPIEVKKLPVYFVSSVSALASALGVSGLCSEIYLLCYAALL